MADLSITAAEVQPSSTAPKAWAILGEACTAGQPVYVKASDSKLYQCDADASAEAAEADGILVMSGSAGQWGVYQKPKSTVVIGSSASVAQGTAYFVSPTKGGICPEADLLTGDYMCYLGIGDASDGIALDIHYSAVQHV